MKDEIKEILDFLKDKRGYYKTFSQDKTDKLYDYITNLEKVVDERMSTILDIEKYCIDEEEDLISGGEVCEDILKIINKLKER